MYKKISLLSVLLCPLTQHASATPRWFEIKPSYFFFSASPMKAIYTRGGFEIQGSISVPFCDYIDFYSSIGLRTARGHALNTKEKTSIIAVPIDIGFKPIFSFSERGYCFFALGPRFFYFHQRNNSPYVSPTLNGCRLGLFANTGVNVLLTTCFVLGVFGEYSYEKKTIFPKKPNVLSGGSVQLGGFAFGVSMGYCF